MDVLGRLQAIWEQRKWEGSTEFMENKITMLNEANSVLVSMLQHNEKLRLIVEREDLELVPMPTATYAHSCTCP